MKKAGWLALVAALGLIPALQGCLPVAAVGMGAAFTSVNDRRTSGTQIDDEATELRASNRISDRFGDKVHVSVVSFNRSVLLTGEVSNEATRGEIEKIVAGLPNVRGIT